MLYIFNIFYEFNTIFKNVLKFFNTRKYTINNDVLIKNHYYTKYIKIKILLKIRYTINNDIVEIIMNTRNIDS